MRRSVFASLFVLFAMSFSFGQVVVTYGGFATMQGPAVPPAPAWPPLLTTPQVQLSTAMSSPIGITNEGRAGISIEGRGLNLEPQPSTVTVPVVTNPGVVVLPAGGAVPPVAPEEAQMEEREGSRPFEFGVGNAHGLTSHGVLTMPLGSAVPGKIEPARPAVHTYNNDDMRRLQTSTQAHVSIVGRK